MAPGSGSDTPPRTEDRRPEGGPELVESAQALFDSLRAIFEKSKEEVVRGARVSRVRLDIYQLKREREHALQRLGEDAYELIRRGDLSVDSLSEAFAAVQGIDVRIDACEAELATLTESGAEPHAAAPATDRAAGTEVESAPAAPPGATPAPSTADSATGEPGPASAPSPGPAAKAGRSSGEAVNRRGRGRAEAEPTPRAPAGRVRRGPAR